MGKKPARAPQGAGTIRKKTVDRGGHTYTYWEARVTTGRDPATGRQKQQSFSGKTQKEVLEKLQRASVEVTSGTYTDPSKLTVAEWADIWTADYLGGVKQSTVIGYRAAIQNHIVPGLGTLRLQKLQPNDIQRFINSLDMSPSTVDKTFRILHTCLQQAVKVGYLKSNPSDVCELPRKEKKELAPLDDTQTKDFLEAIRGHRFEDFYTFLLFTGCREGEALGLAWDSVDFTHGTIQIKQQLQYGDKSYYITSPKSGKPRTITPAPSVMDLLKKRRAAQSEDHLRAGELWSNSDNFVFTDEIGHHLVHSTVWHTFKAIAASIGRPDLRVHDLRHSYAVNALRAGDDPKTVSANLGHATTAFTLDVYGHVTDDMRKASADRMESFIRDVLNL